MAFQSIQGWWCFWVIGVLAWGAPALAEWHNSLRPIGEAGPAITLADNGQSDYMVVIPASPTSQERKAAAELVTWVHEMTGVWLSTVLDTARPIDTEISIGNTNRLVLDGITIDWAALGDEGYAIDVKGKRLFLNGGAKRGPIYAVFALLEEDLGCRWYHMNATEIPRRPVLTFQPVVRRYTPVLYVRDPFYVDAFNAAWSLRNRTNSPRMRLDTEHYASSDAPDVSPLWGGRPVYAPGFVHTFETILPSADYFESHPEYYAQIDGERTPVQLCMTNPESTQIVIERMKRVLAEKTNTTILEISQNDSRAYCQCDRCEAMTRDNNSPAGPQIYFVNQIADAIAETHPHVLVSTLAYLSTLDAPTNIRPSPNVSIRLCNDRQGWRFPLSDFVNNDFERSVEYRNAIVAWSKISNDLSVWDYTVNFSHYLGPMPNLHTLKPNLDFYVAHNVKGMMYQGAFQSIACERGPLRVWVMAKLLWDPSRDVDALTRDFAWGYFGPSAGLILEYYELLDQARLAHSDYYEDQSPDSPGIRYDMNSPMFSKAFISQATKLFADAMQLAENDEHRRRVDLERLPILYVKLMQGPATTGDEYGEVLKQFEQVARRERVDYFSDTAGQPDFELVLQSWRDALDQHLAGANN